MPKSQHFACTGARIPDLLTRQHKAKPDDVPQIERLRQLDERVDIDTVLLTIGGNDMDFAGKIIACYVGHRCLGNTRKLDQRLDALRPKLVHAYNEIADATWGDLIVVGYPDIFPGRKETFRKCGWLGDEEKRGVWHFEEALDSTLRQAAEEADVDFISIRDALDGHEACTPHSVINPIKPLSDGAAHPNAEGQRLLASAVKKQLDEIYADDGGLGDAGWRLAPFGRAGPGRCKSVAEGIVARHVGCRKARRVVARGDAASLDPPAWTQRKQICPLVDLTGPGNPSGTPGKAGDGYNAYLLAIVARRHIRCSRARKLARRHWIQGHARPLRWHRRRAWRSTGGSAYVGDFVGKRRRTLVEYHAVH